MSLNALIASGGVQPTQIESPLNKMARVAQIRNALQENELNQMRLSEARRTAAEGEQVRNLFRAGLDPNDPNAIRQIYGISPTLGQSFEQSQAARQKATTEEAARRNKLAIDKLGMFKEALPGVRTPAQMAEWYRLQAQDPDLQDTPVGQHTIEQKLAMIPQDPAEFMRFRDQVALGLGKWLELNTPKVVGPGAQLREGITGQAVGETTPTKPDDAVSNYEYAKSQGYRGSFFDFQREMKMASRPISTTTPAPAMTEVVDPKDPTRMLRVDARTYQGGSVGSPGVVGVSGKEPVATARGIKQNEGRQLLEDEIENLRAAYMRLDQRGAIPSTQRGATQNVIASVAASPIGQIAGRAVGTEAQTDRDYISSARLRLLNAIKAATGMSAQQMNSNVELQTWMRAVTDPTQSIEAVNQILDSIKDSYARSGGGSSPASPRLPAPPPGFKPD